MQALVWKLQVFQQSPKIQHTHLPLILLDYLLNEESDPGTSDFIIFPESLLQVNREEAGGWKTGQRICIHTFLQRIQVANST